MDYTEWKNELEKEYKNTFDVLKDCKALQNSFIDFIRLEKEALKKLQEEYDNGK